MFLYHDSFAFPLTFVKYDDSMILDKAFGSGAGYLNNEFFYASFFQSVSLSLSFTHTQTHRHTHTHTHTNTHTPHTHSLWPQL